jgi:hypothetical protein
MHSRSAGDWAKTRARSKKARTISFMLKNNYQLI